MNEGLGRKREREEGIVETTRDEKLWRVARSSEYETARRTDGRTVVLFSSECASGLERSVIISFSVARSRERKNNSLSLSTHRPRPTIKTLSRAFSRGGNSGFSLAGLIDPRNPESRVSPPLVELPSFPPCFIFIFAPFRFVKQGEGEIYVSFPESVHRNVVPPERGKHSFSPRKSRTRNPGEGKKCS